MTPDQASSKGASALFLFVVFVAVVCFVLLGFSPMVID